MAGDTEATAAPRRAGAAAVIERVFRGLDAGLRVSSSQWDFLIAHVSRVANWPT